MEPQLLEAEGVDPKEFIMGKWPVGVLLAHGFEQDFQSEYHYNKQISPGLTINVDLWTYEAIDRDYGDRLILDVQCVMDRGTGPHHYGLWSSIVPFTLVEKMLDVVEPILRSIPPRALEPNTDEAKALEKEVYQKLEHYNLKSTWHEFAEGKKSVNVKDYIMSDAWVITDLKKMGFEALGERGNYWLRRFYAQRSKTWAVVVVWFHGLTAHMSVEVLKERKHYEKIWESYVGLQYVARMAEVLIEAYRNLREIKWDYLSMMVKAVGTEKLGKEFPLVYKVPMGEAEDVRGFIARESPFFEFKTKMEESGWHYIGIEQTPNVHGGTVPVHHFDTVYEPHHFSADVSPTKLDCYAAEDAEHKLSAYGGGTRMVLTDELNNQGEPIEEEETWDTEEYIQPSDMSPADFAEWVDDEIKWLAQGDKP